MKKVLALILLSTTLLTGCGRKEFDTSYRTRIVTEYSNPGSYAVSEWTSPDGVHYWIAEGGYRFGIAPRYDKDGKLIIDEE